jgi:hypothetical protein
MTASVNLLDVLGRHLAECEMECARLLAEIEAGNVSGYEKQLADLTASRDEAFAAHRSASELLASATESLMSGCPCSTCNRLRAALAACGAGGVRKPLTPSQQAREVNLRG